MNFNTSCPNGGGLA